MDIELKGKALLTNVNIRAEMHGDDRVLAVDLKLQHTTTLDVLATFSPELRSALYDESQDPPRQRIPHLKPLSFDTKYEHHTLHVSDMTFDDVTISKVSLDPEQYGAVVLGFTASMSEIDANWLPQLAALFLDREVVIDIEPMQAGLDLGDEEEREAA